MVVVSAGGVAGSFVAAIVEVGGVAAGVDGVVVVVVVGGAAGVVVVGVVELGVVGVVVVGGGCFAAGVVAGSGAISWRVRAGLGRPVDRAGAGVATCSATGVRRGATTVCRTRTAARCGAARCSSARGGSGRASTAAGWPPFGSWTASEPRGSGPRIVPGINNRPAKTNPISAPVAACVQESLMFPPGETDNDCGKGIGTLPRYLRRKWGASR